MEHARFFYRLFLVDAGEQPKRYLGAAFAIAPNGSLLTCRHVVDIDIPSGFSIAVFDAEKSRYVPLTRSPIYPPASTVDLAFLPDALNRPKAEHLPVLTPSALKIGEDVYSFGSFAVGGQLDALEQGYFSGKIVNFFRHEQSVCDASITLPYPILEGMSGSAVLTYHNGPKVVGIAIGNKSSRILASEILEYKDEKTEYRETVNRIVEYGVAYHCAAIVSFLSEAAAKEFVVSDKRVAIPHLE